MRLAVFGELVVGCKGFCEEPRRDGESFDIIRSLGKSEAFGVVFGDLALHYDGQLQGDLHEGTQVVVSRAPHTIQFVHPPGYSYFAMLREKLHWSEM